MVPLVNDSEQSTQAVRTPDDVNTCIVAVMLLYKIRDIRFEQPKYPPLLLIIAS